MLASSSNPKTCNPHVPGLNEVDAALVDLDPRIAARLEVLAIGPLTGVALIATLSPGQTVEFTGRTSGHRIVRIGGLAATYRLRLNGQHYCFKNLFELRWPRFYQLPTRRPIAPGDSGAWVCSPDASGYAWCGMVVGGDRLQGYAVFRGLLILVRDE